MIKKNTNTNQNGFMYQKENDTFVVFNELYKDLEAKFDKLVDNLNRVIDILNKFKG